MVTGNEKFYDLAIVIAPDKRTRDDIKLPDDEVWVESGPVKEGYIVRYFSDIVNCPIDEITHRNGDPITQTRRGGFVGDIVDGKYWSDPVGIHFYFSKKKYIKTPLTKELLLSKPLGWIVGKTIARDNRPDVIVQTVTYCINGSIVLWPKYPHHTICFGINNDTIDNPTIVEENV